MSRRNTVEQDGVKYDTANAATTEAIDYRDKELNLKMQLTIAYFCSTIIFNKKNLNI